MPTADAEVGRAPDVKVLTTRIIKTFLMPPSNILGPWRCRWHAPKPKTVLDAQAGWSVDNQVMQSCGSSCRVSGLLSQRSRNMPTANAEGLYRSDRTLKCVVVFDLSNGYAQMAPIANTIII